MKKFIEEFKAFISRGNVMDMAIGIIMGSAFTAIVTSLVDNILSPLLGFFVNGDFSYLTVRIGSAEFALGKFIMSVINFLIIAVVLFIMLKLVMRITSVRNRGKEEEKEEPTKKECPFCFSEINIKALRCPCCTAELPEEVKESETE